MTRIVTCAYCHRKITLIDERSVMPSRCPSREHSLGNEPPPCVAMTDAERMSSDTVNRMAARAGATGSSRKSSKRR